jgi:hypothetical protein
MPWRDGQECPTRVAEAVLRMSQQWLMDNGLTIPVASVGSSTPRAIHSE